MRDNALRRFAARVTAVRNAVDTFDSAGGFARGFLARRDRAALDSEISNLLPAMLAVKAEGRRQAEAATPDYKEIARVFGIALGTALSARNGDGWAATKKQGGRVDRALREIFKIDVDKPD